MQKFRRKLSPQLVVIVVLGVIGTTLIGTSLAATPYASVQTTSAKTADGASIVANSKALGGKMLIFNKPTSTSPSKNQVAVKSSTSSGPSQSSTSTSSGSTGTSGSSGSSSSPTNPPASSACTNPSWNTSQATGTDPISETWWVNNDAWSGSHGPQTLYVCNQSSWYAVSNQTNNGGQVETYPDTEYDVGGRNSPSTKTIAQYSSITSTFSETYPSAGSWDAAYDLWTNNWTNETMVWNQWTGTEDYWGGCAEPGASQNDCVGTGGASNNSQAAMINGVSYHFLALGTSCSAANESKCEYIFFRDSQVASGSLDILAIYQWEVANGYAKSTDVPTQLEYGVEVCSTSGTETFPMNGLTFSVN